MRSISNIFKKNPKINFATIRQQFHQITNFHEKTAFLSSNYQLIYNYLSGFSIDNSTVEYTKNYLNDALIRFFNTLSLLPEIKTHSKLLEIGSNPYLQTILLQKLFSYDITQTNFFDYDVYNSQVKKFSQTITNSSLHESYKFDSILYNLEVIPHPIKDNSFDIILFSEVLEHLVVNPLKIFSEFQRILKKSGYLLITTPNAARLTNIATLLKGENIFDLYHPENGIFGRHNREFTLKELEFILSQNNFKIVFANTYDRYDYDQIDIFSVGYHGLKKIDYKKSDLIHKIKQINGNTNNIGDNLYILCQKV